MSCQTVEHYQQLPIVPADHRYAYGADASHFADLFLPAAPGPHPVLVLIHGGCWQAAYGLEPLGQLARAIAVQGIAVWNIEYRRLGNGGGWPHTLLDAGAALDFLPTIAKAACLDLSRVVTAGHSAGGQLALWLAGRRRLPVRSLLYAPAPLPVYGVISLAGIPDLAAAAREGICGAAVSNLLGGSPQQRTEHYAAASPYALTPLGVHHLHIHGEDDEVVPVESVRRYVSYALQAGDQATMLALPAAGHFELVDARTHAAAVFLRALTHLVKPG
jgi:acetyl esterase/lipase